MKFSCCYLCENRTPDCRIDCEKYKKNLEEYRKYKEEIRRKKQVDVYFNVRRREH